MGQLTSASLRPVIVEPDLAQYKDEFNEWLNNQYQRWQMDYLANHGDKWRFYPEQLHPGTRRVISLRIGTYLPQSSITVGRLKTKNNSLTIAR